MKEEICNNFKYGYCKFKLNCKKELLTEECPERNNCTNKSNCNRRHRKRYKFQGATCFRKDCEYFHDEEALNNTTV